MSCFCIVVEGNFKRWDFASSVCLLIIAVIFAGGDMQFGS